MRQTDSFDHNKRIIYTVLFPKWPGTWQFDNINRMITLSVITLSGLHCMWYQTSRHRCKIEWRAKITSQTLHANIPCLSESCFFVYLERHWNWRRHGSRLKIYCCLLRMHRRWRRCRLAEVVAALADGRSEGWRSGTSWCRAWGIASIEVRADRWHRT